MILYELELYGGQAFLVNAPLANLVKILDYHDKPSCGYYAYVMISDAFDRYERLVFQIWDMEDETRMEIDGCNTFIFNISPHSDNLEESDSYDEEESDTYDKIGYDYRPAERYGSVDDERCERYDDFRLYPAIKQLAFDLVESIKKQYV